MNRQGTTSFRRWSDTNFGVLKVASPPDAADRRNHLRFRVVLAEMDVARVGVIPNPIRVGAVAVRWSQAQK